MRALAVALALGLLLGAGSATALTLTPDPVTHTRGSGETGGPLSASVSVVSISGADLTLELSVSEGSVDYIDVSALFVDFQPGLGSNFVAGASVNNGTGTVTPSVSFGSGEAEFTFTTPLGAGEASDELVVTYQNPIQAGFDGSIGFESSNLVQGETFEVVPEPGTGLLLGLGLAGFVVRRCR